ncbi:MAG: hypothetical protein ACR2GO_08620 [Candidatus Limnocylindria bacterium]
MNPAELPCFDGYPYLVTRIGRCALRGIALVPADWPRGRIIELARTQADLNRLETAACFGTNDAEYVSADATRTSAGRAPSGILVVDGLHLAETFSATRELTARAAELKMFADAFKPTGYIVGDGTDGGRRVDPAAIERLTSIGSDGLPGGLERCPTCGEVAGDYYRKPNGVIRVWCACDNHNRCARCREPLARHRLSAWYWDEEKRAPWHLAAYAAFAHRCDD